MLLPVMLPEASATGVYFQRALSASRPLLRCKRRVSTA